MAVEPFVIVLVIAVGLPVLILLARLGQAAQVKADQKDYWATLPPPATPAQQVTCPKCGRTMVQGFVPDLNYQAVGISVWVEGPPQKSFWSGTDARWERSIPIATFRCSGCGYLESYARPEFAHR